MTHAALKLVSALCVLLPAATDAAAQHAYPAKGQSPAKQEKDEAYCSRWATGKTGYDPARPPPTAYVEPAPVTGSGVRARGAARGAALGAITGGDVGGSAVAGAAVGGIRGRIANQREADAQNQAIQQQAASARGSYLQARAACLSGRGYTVK